MTSDDAEDVLWDLSNSTSNHKSSSSAPSTEVRGVSYMNQDVNDSFQESVQEISSEEHSDESNEHLQESRRKRKDSVKTTKRSSRPRSVDHAANEHRVHSKGRQGPPSSDPTPKRSTSSTSSHSRHRGGGVEGQSRPIGTAESIASNGSFVMLERDALSSTVSIGTARNLIDVQEVRSGSTTPVTAAPLKRIHGTTFSTNIVKLDSRNPKC